MIALYTRVSTQEQAREGYSIEEQASRLRSYCDAMGWPDHQLYTDPGFSGGSMDRPALQQLIRDVESGQITRVVVYKLDRLSRSQLDTLYLIERVFLAHGSDFVSLSESFDTGTPFGRAMIGILAVFAQLEREQIKERMTMGREARAKEGKFHGGAHIPIGYDYVDGELVVNPPEAMQVREVYRQYLSGTPIRQIQADLIRRGLTHHCGAWNTKTIRYVLRNRSYIGEVSFGGKWYPGTHEPLIDPATWQTVQERLDQRAEMTVKHQQTSGRSTLLSGLLWCARCGARYGISGTLRTGRYYRCYSVHRQHPSMVRDPNCDNTSWREDELNEAILGQIAQLATDPAQIPRVSSQPHPEEQIAALEAQLAEVRRRKARLLDLYAAETALTPSELSARINPLSEQEGRLNGEIEALRASSGVDEKKAAQIVATFADVIARDVYTEKRALVESLIDRIELDGRQLTIRWKF